MKTHLAKLDVFIKIDTKIPGVFANSSPTISKFNSSGTAFLTKGLIFPIDISITPKAQRNSIQEHKTPIFQGIKVLPTALLPLPAYLHLLP